MRAASKSFQFLTLEETAIKILSERQKISSDRSVLIGISGIDGCGKGYITRNLQNLLNAQTNTVSINIDGWLNLPTKRFNPNDLAFHFYKNAIRFDEMFSQLILPLKANRFIDLISDFTEETASDYRKHHYSYSDVHVILLEGIYLFKKEFRPYFDLKIWIECSFETALRRAIERSQEGLGPDETIRAYENIYFPAQRIHFQEDRPLETCDGIIHND